MNDQAAFRLKFAAIQRVADSIRRPNTTGSPWNTDSRSAEQKISGVTGR